MKYRLLVDIQSTDTAALASLENVFSGHPAITSVSVQTTSEKNVKSTKEMVAVILLSVAANHATDISRDLMETISNLDYAEIIAIEPIDPADVPEPELPDAILPRREDD